MTRNSVIWHAAPEDGALAARIGRYLRREDLRQHPLRLVGRRLYLETVNRMAPRRLARLHEFVLQGTPYRMRVPLTDAVGRALYLSGTYEALAIQVFAACVDAGDVAIDVGSHYGEFALMAAFRVGDHGRVIAFEPQPQVRAVLENNISLNGIGNVNVFGMALSDYTGVARLFRADKPAETGCASLSATVAGQETHWIEVDVEPLDATIPHALSSRVVAIKIDVEGEEAQVLLGSRRVVAASSPAILFEVNHLTATANGVGCRSFDVARSMGYRLYGIIAEGSSPQRFRLEAIGSGSDPRRYREPWRALNVVAIVPGSHAYERLRAGGVAIVDC